MDSALLANVIGTLFPRQKNDNAREAQPSSTETKEWSEELEVTDDELLDATKRMASRDVARGPDGVPGRVCAESIGIRKEGVYPQAWRTAKLVLLKKEGPASRWT
jgi:hypothetical protein